MPGVGVGGFLSNLINPGLDDQIAAAVTPNPNPLAQQGQGAPATSGSPTLPNAAATKMDPYVGNLAGMLLKRDRQAQLAADFNNNLGSIAAGFGTREQQASKQAALRGGGGAGGGIGDVGDIMKIQQAVTDQNEHARFMANMSVLAKILFPGDPEGVAKATEVANSQGIMLPDFSKASAANATTTNEVKNADEATKSYIAANPNATPQEIANFRSSTIAMGSGVTMEDQGYRAYAQREIAAGRKPVDINTWKAQAKDVQDLKSTGTTDFSAANEKLDRNEKTVQWLLDHVDATRAALSKPEMFTSDKIAANTPDWIAYWEGATPEVKLAAANIKTVINDLSAQGLRDLKNLRNVREFNAAAGSLTSGLNANNPDLAGSLGDVMTKLKTAHAQVYATAGKQIPRAYNGLANEDLLDPNNPYYTGASYEPPPKGDKGADGALKPLDDAAKAKAQTLIQQHGRDYVIKYLKDNGYDTSGL